VTQSSKRQKVKVTLLRKPSRSHVASDACAAAAGVGVHVDTTAYVF